MKVFRYLWKNREAAYKLLKWFQNIVTQASDMADALKRLQESVAKGDLNDLVERTQAVADRRKDYVG